MLIPMLAFAMIAAPAGPYAVGTGGHLYKSCKVLVRLWDGEAQTDTSAITECSTYVSGFIDGHNFTSAPTKAGEAAKPVFCRDGASMGAMIRVYLNYMDKNPKLFDAPEMVGLAFSLMDAYPCQAIK